MRIVAALCWYDEEPETLTSCVQSLAGVADTIVALDGRWVGFSGGSLVSPPEQHEALAAAAATAGLELVASSGAGLWQSQVAKRDGLLRMACETGCDWVLVIDGDEHIEACDPLALRAVLTATDRDVADVQLRNAGPRVKNLSWRRARRLLRASSCPTSTIAHCYVAARDGSWLAGDPSRVQLAPAADATTLRIVNNVGVRPAARRKAAELYYRTRKEPVPA